MPEAPSWAQWSDEALEQIIAHMLEVDATLSYDQVLARCRTRAGTAPGDADRARVRTIYDRLEESPHFVLKRRVHLADQRQIELRNERYRAEEDLNRSGPVGWALLSWRSLLSSSEIPFWFKGVACALGGALVVTMVAWVANHALSGGLITAGMPCTRVAGRWPPAARTV